jgi:hypothetical protein
MAEQQIEVRMPVEVGLLCRKCGCRHFNTIRIEHRPGFILRRRECRHCKTRATTREVIISK